MECAISHLPPTQSHYRASTAHTASAMLGELPGADQSLDKECGFGSNIRAVIHCTLPVPLSIGSSLLSRGLLTAECSEGCCSSTNRALGMSSVRTELLLAWEDKIGLELDIFTYIPLISSIRTLHMLDFLLPAERSSSQISQRYGNGEQDVQVELGFHLGVCLRGRRKGRVLFPRTVPGTAVPHCAGGFMAPG